MTTMSSMCNIYTTLHFAQEKYREENKIESHTFMENVIMETFIQREVK